jgi:hypothetical protein
VATITTVISTLAVANDMGETQIVGQELLETPSWQWPAR